MASVIVRNLRTETITAEQTLLVRQCVFMPTKSLEKNRISGDEYAVHFGAFWENELVSVVSVFKRNQSAQLRKMATLRSFRRRGIASSLLMHVLATMRKNFRGVLWLQAEEVHCGFYQSCGFRIDGSRYCRHGVTYFRMNAVLPQAGN